MAGSENEPLHHDDSHNEHFSFEDVLFAMMFLCVIWAAGKFCERFKLPALIGQIFAGALMGPELADIVPEPMAFQMLGEIGLIMLVIEAGLEVDLAGLRQYGVYGLLIGITGGVLPVLLGTGIGMILLGMEFKAALAAGACFGPTSMGVALVVLEKGKVLCTPLGQTIVTAAVVDDVLALVILAELRALESPSPVAFVAPVAAALGFTALIGYAACLVMPKLLPDALRYLHRRHWDDALLGVVVSTAAALMCALHFGRGSYLFGAFLGGMCFCTNATVLHAWNHQARRILHWLLRVFFAATVGFQIPIRHFWSTKVVSHGCAFFLALLGKVVMGAFARPLSLDSFLVVGASMATWGEFAFVIAVEAKALGLIGPQDYAAVIFAVLLSVLISPYALTMAIERSALSRATGDSDGEDDNPRGRVFYKLFVRVHRMWGLDLFVALTNLGLTPLESHCELMDDGFCMFEAYLVDGCLRDEDPLTEAVEGLGERLAVLRRKLRLYFVSKDRSAHDYGDWECALQPGALSAAGEAACSCASAEVGSGLRDHFRNLVGFALVRWVPGRSPEEREELSLDVEKAKTAIGRWGFVLHGREHTDYFEIDTDTELGQGKVVNLESELELEMQSEVGLELGPLEVGDAPLPVT